MGNVSKASADTLFQGEKFTDIVKFNGDMRLRHEFFKYTQAGVADQNRERFRFRFGATATMQDFIVGFRLASGAGQAVSTNQTETGAFSQKPIWIDQAYITWKALATESFNAKVTGGKMQNPFFANYSSDIVWDPDINPEGYAQQLDYAATDRIGLFANFAQLPLLDGGRTIADPWMFGNQIGARTKLTEDTKLTLAGNFYGFIREDAANLNPVQAPFATAPNANQQGNARVGATQQLATELRLLHFAGELASHVGSLPVSLQGDLVHNTQDTQKAGATGYQTGLVVGQAKVAKTWEAAYFYKYTGFNSTYADIADSDWGNGGLNRKGHIFWIAYAPRDFVQIKAKYYVTDVINPFIGTDGLSHATIQSNNTGSNGSLNRFQLDVVVKF
jgi:hypothetical protein